jgi:hypothetical protein
MYISNSPFTTRILIDCCQFVQMDIASETLCMYCLIDHVMIFAWEMLGNQSYHTNLEALELQVSLYIIIKYRWSFVISSLIGDPLHSFL